MAPQQSKFLNDLQSTIELCKCVVLCDFSKYYFFILWDEAKGLHWNIAQATIHPFACTVKTAFLLQLLMKI
jgi:hypothetical protein